MSTGTNLSRINSPRDIQVLLNQWPNIPEDKFLLPQFGADFNSLIEWIVFNDTNFRSYNPTPSMFFRVKPGNISDTFLEPYRNIDLISISSENIPGILNCFPFSFFKPGTDPESYADLNEDIIDAGNLVGLEFFKTNLVYSFAAMGSMNGCKFIGCNLRNSDWTGRVLQNCLFENCDMQFMRLMSSEVLFDQEPMYFYTTFKKCNMSNTNAQKIATSNCYFIECKINDASWDLVNSSTWSEYTTFNKCEINNTRLGLGRDSTLATKFNNCEIVNSILEGDSSDAYGGLEAENSVFDNSELKNVSITGNCKNNSFKNVNFSPDIPGGVFVENADLSGTDFTGSNLDSFYATKADLIATGSTYDERTLWVDGTSL